MLRTVEQANQMRAQVVGQLAQIDQLLQALPPGSPQAQSLLPMRQNLAGLLQQLDAAMPDEMVQAARQQLASRPQPAAPERAANDGEAKGGDSDAGGEDDGDDEEEPDPARVLEALRQRRELRAQLQDQLDHIDMLQRGVEEGGGQLSDEQAASFSALRGQLTGLLEQLDLALPDGTERMVEEVLQAEADARARGDAPSPPEAPTAGASGEPKAATPRSTGGSSAGAGGAGAGGAGAGGAEQQRDDSQGQGQGEGDAQQGDGVSPVEEDMAEALREANQLKSQLVQQLEQVTAMRKAHAESGSDDQATAEMLNAMHGRLSMLLGALDEVMPDDVLQAAAGAGAASVATTDAGTADGGGDGDDDALHEFADQLDTLNHMQDEVDE